MNKKDVVQGFGAFWEYISSREISIVEKFFVIGFVLAYIVSPFDLIPDIPVLGWLDDFGVGALFIAFCNYRVNHLKTEDAETEKEIIDVTPVEEKSADSDKPIGSLPKSTFSFSRKR